MTVRSANIGANFVTGFRAMGGGEVTEYTKLVYESRQQVMQRMWEQAVPARRDGDCCSPIRHRVDRHQLLEVCAYGTAVVAVPIPAGDPGATPQSAADAQARAAGAS